MYVLQPHCQLGSQPLSVAAAQPWPSRVPSVCLSFLIYEMGMMGILSAEVMGMQQVIYVTRARVVLTCAVEACPGL